MSKSPNRHLENLKKRRHFVNNCTLLRSLLTSCDKIDSEWPSQLENGIRERVDINHNKIETTAFLKKFLINQYREEKDGKYC